MFNFGIFSNLPDFVALYYSTAVYNREVLNLNRRHKRDCIAGHPEGSLTPESDERRDRKRAKCGCYIFVSGTLLGKFKRQTTAHWEWEPARLVMDARAAVGSWDEAATPLPCHCLVRDGLIEYLAGTGHFLAGHRLLLPDWE
jgi:hypothetical protein